MTYSKERDYIESEKIVQLQAKLSALDRVTSYFNVLIATPSCFFPLPTEKGKEKIERCMMSVVHLLYNQRSFNSLNSQNLKVLCYPRAYYKVCPQQFGLVLI